MTSIKGANTESFTEHRALNRWIEKMVVMCQPDSIHWCNGTEEESAGLFAEMEARGMCQKLNEELRPNSYLFRSDPRDGAGRVAYLYLLTES